jgi:homoserine acetyltransferase
MNIPAEKEILEDLAVQVLRLITGKSLNTRQVLVLLELVQAEVKECALV